jgi:hypothetical protein
MSRRHLDRVPGGVGVGSGVHYLQTPLVVRLHSYRPLLPLNHKSHRSKLIRHLGSWFGGTISYQRPHSAYTWSTSTCNH